MERHTGTRGAAVGTAAMLATAHSTPVATACYLRREASDDDALHIRRRLHALARDAAASDNGNGAGRFACPDRSSSLRAERPSTVDSHVPSGAPALDLQLQKYLRGAAARERDIERVGPFTATFDRRNDNMFLNYAIPDDGARPTAEDVAALAAAYRRRGRMPRWSTCRPRRPRCEAALLAGGFTAERRAAGHDVRGGHGRRPRARGRGDHRRARDRRGVARMAAAQHAAFGTSTDEAAIDYDEVGRQRERLTAGGLALLARDDATGAIVGGGVATVPGDGVTEVAGIGVRESNRRRGIAGAITAGLARAAFAAGLTTVWLTPGDDGAHRVYARAGFMDTTVILHVSAPVD